MRTRKTLVLAMAAALALACGGGGGEPMNPDDGNGNGNGGGQQGEVVEVELVGLSFTPSTVTIDVGTTVRWRNTTSGVLHTVTPRGHTQWVEFRTSTQGETFEVTFDEAGTFPYACVPHESQGMTGTVIVQ